MSSNNTYYIHNENIIVQLGGMQISREQLDAVKVAYSKDSDQAAAAFLINYAERAFTDLVDSAEDVGYEIEAIKK